MMFSSSNIRNLTSLGALLVAAAAPPSLAQPLPPASYVVEAHSQFAHNEGYVGAVPLSLHVDWIGQWGDLDYSIQATAETFGGLSPMAAVQVEVNSSRPVGFRAWSYASVDYLVRLRPRATPPAGSYSIPLLVRARGEVDGHANSFIRVNHGIPVQRNTINGHQSFEAVFPIDVYYDPADQSGNLVLVELHASAEAYHAHPTFASSSQAYADPVFSFDQATFDLYQGAGTFPLADYFEFEYSEYLLNPPAPPSVTTHPQSQSVCAPGAATFAAVASSTAPMTYQWRVNGSDVADGDGVSGATTPTLTIAPALAIHNGSYDCVITNIAGSVPTNPAALTINSADFNNDGDIGTDADIEAFFACLGGNCCATCGTADFNGDGDVGTDADIESFFRVLAGGAC